MLIQGRRPKDKIWENIREKDVVRGLYEFNRDTVKINKFQIAENKSNRDMQESCTVEEAH